VRSPGGIVSFSINNMGPWEYYFASSFVDALQ
jgi:hypothetical protein